MLAKMRRLGGLGK